MEIVLTILLIFSTSSSLFSKEQCYKQIEKAPSRKWVEGTKPSEMPPMRRIGIDSGHRVTVCNSIPGELELTGLDVTYYVKAVEKLVIT